MTHGSTRNARAVVAALVLGLGILAGSAPVQAQADYPSRQIDFIIPFPPGGPLDAAVRIMHPALQATLGQPVVLVNKGGGGGALGMDAVAKAKPDGYTVAASVKSTLTILPATRKDLPYKPGDFIPVVNAVTDLGVVTAKATGKWKSLEELVGEAKKTPGKLTYGSAGVGTVSFFMMEIIKLAYGIDIAHVPFQGTGPVKNALLGGHVDLGASGFSALGPLIKSGELVPLVTTSPKRVAAYPNVPTMAEKGFPEASINIAVSFYVPAGTPKDVVARLAGAVEKAVKDPAVAGALEKTGMIVDLRDGATLAKDIETERAAVTKVVEKVGIGK
ncbi:MAG: tripartite tricarboxylate transporter substrate binding protein [Candidatus Rokubacteria bacterium]|nr:tripartite tricarboxylate transporter substrate binding protein [Candidatus Rokubacteria bacterium]